MINQLPQRTVKLSAYIPLSRLIHISDDNDYMYIDLHLYGGETNTEMFCNPYIEQIIIFEFPNEVK